MGIIGDSLCDDIYVEIDEEELETLRPPPMEYSHLVQQTTKYENERHTRKTGVYDVWELTRLLCEMKRI